MRNLAIIIPTLNGGGAERTASNLSIFFDKIYNVHLIVFDARNIRYPYAGTLHDLSLPPKTGKIGKLINLIRRISRTKKIKAIEKIDVSISLMDGPNLVNIFSRNGHEVVITSIRIFMSKASGFSGSIPYFREMLMKITGSKSDKIVTLSKGVESDLIKSFHIPPSKITTIYNPCDGELLLEKSSLDILRSMKMGAHSVATMGRMTPQKGQWLLIRAFSKVLKRIPDAKLYILGTGILESRLKELAEKLHISSSIEFCGFMEAPHRLIQACRVFVFPSLYEGLGNVIIESLACGTPAIACDCLSGPREILAPDTEYVGSLKSAEYGAYGILVKVANDNTFDAKKTLSDTEIQLADAIIDVLENDHVWERYHNAALLRSKFFSYNSIMREWQNLIEHCIS